MSFQLRAALPSDVAFLTDMLVEAADWQHDASDNPGRHEQAMRDEKVARYILGWQRTGDQGVVAQDDDSKPIGACWLRLFTTAEPAYGFVAEDVPELAVGLVAAWRGKGIGRTLLRETLSRARAAGFERISLSVDHANPARRLYLSEGFGIVESRPTAATMVKRLR